MNVEQKRRMEQWVGLINNVLEKVLTSSFDPIKDNRKELCEAIKYSVLNGGKRLRGVFVLEIAQILGGSVVDALPCVCAVEMIHAYSLIHDDIMDNDDMRRGKPSCHKKFSVPVAILAGDALTSISFQVILDSPLKEDVKLRCLSFLANTGGLSGLCGGQMLDLAGAENKDELTLINTYKTGALFAAAAGLGVISASNSMKVTEEQKNTTLRLMMMLGQDFGEIFQIVDDILDVVSTEEKLGKPIGSDKREGKNTYVDFYGLDSAKAIAKAKYDEFEKKYNMIPNIDFMLSIAKETIGKIDL
jgi:geranylgeranyl diphosphate synthase type II